MAEDFRHGIDWQKAVEGVPTFEYAIEDMDLSDTGQLEEALNNLHFYLEEGSFVTWEAVIRQEQDLPLGEAHKNALKSLIGFDDDDIHYIDETPRPRRPWYETFRTIVSHLPVETFDTAEPQYMVITEGWHWLVEALKENGTSLSLPEGADVCLDVIRPELRHRLYLQGCFDELAGIGQDDSDGDIITLKDEYQLDSIEEFIELLRDCKEDIRALDLTLEKLLEILVMPPDDLAIFVKVFTETLGLKSSSDPIADHL